MPEFIKPFAIIILRVIPSAVIFFMISFLFKKEKILSKDKFKLILCALTGVVVNQLLFFKGLSLTTPVNGALIMTSNPVLVMLFAALILKEKITTSKITGIILGVTGAIGLILLGNKFTADNGSPLGDLLIFINSISFALFLIMAKPLFSRYHPLTITKWIFFFGSFMVLPFGINELEIIQWSTIPFKIWLCLLFVIIAVTLVAYLLNIFALRTLSPSVVSMYIYFQPVFATLIAVFMGFSKPTGIHFLAAVFIFTGVYLVSRKSRPLSESH